MIGGWWVDGAGGWIRELCQGHQVTLAFEFGSGYGAIGNVATLEPMNTGTPSQYCELRIRGEYLSRGGRPILSVNLSSPALAFRLYPVSTTYCLIYFFSLASTIGLLIQILPKFKFSSSISLLMFVKLIRYYRIRKVQTFTVCQQGKLMLISSIPNTTR